MPWVDARRVVTFMTYIHSFRYGAVMKLPGYAVSILHALATPSSANVPIARRESVCCPLPTVILTSYVNLFPEPIY